MKLLELHIRNIASIEKADIDFEHQDGLIDPDTGRPSQMFLIFGDTGTGKSVLLDGIAMALFKNTPRIAGVSARTRNTFTSSGGNEVKIFSIEQYTRIGISPKDECYSEVAFEGNDGNHYRARLELGYNRNMRYKSNWFLQKDTSDWEKVDKDGQMITHVIGLTFDQFCRMAMLAQGQFASFLCGDKKERADILEKITDTAIFSQYGAAIKSLFDKKHKTYISSQSAYDEALKHIIPPDELADLQRQCEESGLVIKTVSDAREKLSLRLNLVQKIDDASNAISLANAKLEDLSNIKKNDDYILKKQLIADWDSTDEERRRYNDLLLNRDNLRKATELETSLRNQFSMLSMALACQQRQLADDEQQLSLQQRWLEEREAFDTIYSDARVVCNDMDAYSKTLSQIAALDKQKREKESLTPKLLDELERAGKNKEATDLASQRGQEEIDSLVAQRDALNANVKEASAFLRMHISQNEHHDVAFQLQQLAKLDAAFDKLHDDLVDFGNKEKQLAEQATQLITLQQQHAEALASQQQAEATYNADSQTFEAARNRFTTINASLDDKIRELRHKMATGHAELCPLCGQKIASNILSEEQFRDIVSPFKAEQLAAQKKAEQSLMTLSDANKKLNTIEGQIKVCQVDLDSSSKEHALKRTLLDGRLKKAGIDTDADTLEAIRLKRDAIANETEQLNKKKQQADQLQIMIDAAHKTKQDADKRKAANDRAMIDATNRLEQNNESVRLLALHLSQQQANADTLHKQIDSALASWYNGKPGSWSENITAVRQQLARESEEYLNNKKNHQKKLAEHENEKVRLSQMTENSKRIMASFPSWEATIANTEHAPSSSCKATPSQWGDLMQRCSSLASQMASARRNIMQCNEYLDAWQLASGKTIDQLASLIGHRSDISSARQYLQDVASQQASWEKSAADMHAVIAQCREALHLDDNDTPPDHAALQDEMNLLKERENQAREQYAAADTRLKTNGKDQANLQAVGLAMETAKAVSDHWETLNKHFGGERFRNLVQTYILRPLLNNANIYLRQISDRYTLTCSEENEQLSILVLDRYNRDETRSAAVLSGGEKFMISLALSLALSSLNRPDLNTNILFIDEGFGTLDQECLDSVMKTLGRLPEITGQGNRRVGIISHREELLGCIPNKIKLLRRGEGRSRVEVCYEN